MPQHRYDLDVWKLLFEVLREGAISRVAIRNGMDRAQLSRIIAGLEEEVGRPLLSRSGRRITPTQFALEAQASLEPLLKQFEDRGWIETVGWRETPGRPALLGTTKTFLNDLGLKSLAELPNLKEAPSEEFELGDENPEAQESPVIGSMQLQEELNFDQERNEGSRESPAGPADEEAHALPRAHEEAPSDASASGSGGGGNAGGSGV